MPCFPPSASRDVKWHILLARYGEAFFPERAEFIRDNGSGDAVWVRWHKRRRTSDFGTLCPAEYCGPALDQRDDSDDMAYIAPHHEHLN